MAIEEPLSRSDLADLDARYPVWQSTDWTVWQRQRAVAGQLLVAAACALLAWSLAVWGTESLASSTLAPIALTLLCLGVGLLNVAYWYRYHLAANHVGRRASQAQALTGLMALEMVVSLIMLGMQVIGAVLVAWIGFPLWQGFSPFSYAIPVAVGFVAFAGSLGAASGFAWSPTRAPDTPGGASTALTASPHGVRLLVRWLVLLVASRGGIFIMIPALTLLTGYTALMIGERDAMFSIPTTSRVLMVIALLFFLSAVSELSLWVSTRGQAPPK